MTPYYDHAGITLYCGDCRDVLPTLPTRAAGLLLTDPPYGMDYESNARTHLGTFGTMHGDTPATDVTGMIGDALLRLATHRHLYVFQRAQGGNVCFDALPVSQTADLIWDKLDHGGQGNLNAPWATSHERIVFAAHVPSKAERGDGRGSGVARLRRGSVLRHRRVHGQHARHPTQKPVSLLRELIEMSTRADDVVLDPFAGVGSTLVAAALEGRRAVGIELDEAYCAIAVQRLQAMQPHLDGLARL